jgi:hypothetical protein
MWGRRIARLFAPNRIVLPARRLDSCPSCGYSLAGLAPSGLLRTRCPECGAEFVGVRAECELLNPSIARTLYSWILPPFAAMALTVVLSGLRRLGVSSDVLNGATFLCACLFILLLGLCGIAALGYFAWQLFTTPKPIRGYVARRAALVVGLYLLLALLFFAWVAYAPESVFVAI